jgi:hypothetical protein
MIPPGRQERHLDWPGANTPASDGHDPKTYLNRPDDANQGTSGLVTPASRPTFERLLIAQACHEGFRPVSRDPHILRYGVLHIIA